MKGEKRLAAAMLVAELTSAEELCGILEKVKVVFAFVRILREGGAC